MTQQVWLFPHAALLPPPPDAETVVQTVSLFQ
jgi:hypothetical protein